MLSRFGAAGRRGPVLPVLLMVAVFVAACGGAAGLAGAPQAGPAFGNDSGGETSGDGVQFGPQSGDNGSGTRDVVYAAGAQDLLIIKNGEMVIQVQGIDAALTAATQQITALGGYASGSERSGDGESDQASVSYRIPAAKWDEAIAGLHKLGTKVLAERTGTDDVTDQVVDLGARIRNLQTTETALQSIMARATEIKDVLAVQAELTSVRGQIEQLTAQKTSLEQQAAMSTLRVTFSLKPDPVLASSTEFDPSSQVDQAVASLIGVLQAVASAGIWFAIVWLPILIALGILVVIVMFVLRRFSRSSSGTGTPTPTTDTPTAESGA
jgi:cell division protein FtsL